MAPTSQAAVVVALVFGATIFDGNEAFRIDKSQQDSRNALATFAGLSVDEIMRTMTVSDAVDILNKSDISAKAPGLLVMCQERLRKGQQSNLRRERSRKTDPSTTLVPAYNSSGTDNAKIKLNEMILETTEEMDLKNITCGSEERKKRYLRDELQQEESKFAGLVLGAEGERVTAQSDIDRLTAAQNRLKQIEIPDHERECTENNYTLYRQLELVTGDLRVMSDIANMTQCAKPSEYVLVSTESSCEAAGQTTITGEDECLSAANFLNMQDVDGKITTGEDADRKTGCTWDDAGHVMLFDPTGDPKKDEPCNYGGLAGCLCLKATDTASSFLQMECTDPATGRQWMELRPNSQGQQQLSKLHTEKVKQLLQQTGLVLGYAGNSLLQQASKGPEDYESKVGRGTCSDKELILTSGGWLNESSVQDQCRQLDCKFYVWNKNSTVDNDSLGHAWFCRYSAYETVKNEAAYPLWVVGRPKPEVELPEGQLTAKCSIGASPMCAKLQERFQGIEGGMMDAKEELLIMISDLDLHCKGTSQTMKDQMELYGKLIMEANKKLVNSETDKKSYTDSQGSNHDLYLTAAAEYIESVKGCDAAIANLKNEKCALRTIRNELMKMSALVTVEHVQDCEMQEWRVDEQCTVDCGGGIEKLIRSPAEFPNGGAACPIERVERSCNEQACPVDCVVKEWSSWSTCTATCGGGIRERSLEVEPPKHDGQPCPSTLMEEQCAAGSCGGDCELADWTKSKECNKKCGGGVLKSTRAVVKEAWGEGGTCPSFYDNARYRLEECNKAPCENHAKPVHCKSKLDVTFVLDGSGSLGAAGFQSVKDAAHDVILSMDGQTSTGDVMVNVILFSGPKSWQSWYVCAGIVDELDAYWKQVLSQSHPNFRPQSTDECGIQNIRTDNTTTGNNYWTSDTLGAATVIQDLKFPEAGTWTSSALIRAREGLTNSRQNVPSVVVLITDGRAFSAIKTKEQADALKAGGARLVIIAAGQGLGPEDIDNMKLWSGGQKESWQEGKSFMRVDQLEDLDTVFTVNNMVENICDPSGIVDPVLY